MKHFFILFSLCLVIVFTLGGESVFAQAPPPDKIPTGVTTAQGLVDLVKIITDWVFVVLVVVAIIFIILAAFQFVTGGGDPAAVGEARTKLIWAAVGIGVALLSRGFSGAIEDIVGQVPLPGAQAHWKLDEGNGPTAKDSAGKSDGTITGATWATAAECGLGLGACLKFDGNGDYVKAEGLGIPANGPATIAGWYKFGRFASEPHPFDNSNHRIWLNSILAQLLNNRLYVMMGEQNDNFDITFGVPTVEKGKWHHLALTYNGNASTAKLYFDGDKRVFSAGVQGTPDNFAALSTFLISGGNTAGDELASFQGYIDDVRVHKQVLTKKQIKALFQMGKP